MFERFGVGYSNTNPGCMLNLSNMTNQKYKKGRSIQLFRPAANPDNPRRRYGPTVRMDGGCYAIPVVGGRNPRYSNTNPGCMLNLSNMTNQKYEKGRSIQLFPTGHQPRHPRRRYGPTVKMDGGCYTMYTMYTMYPSLGGGTPGGTPVIQILKLGGSMLNLSNI